MKVTSDLLRGFGALGLTVEQVAGVVCLLEADDAERRVKERDKKRRQRGLSPAVPGTERDREGHEGDNPGQVSPKEKSPTPPKEITPSRSEAKASSRDIRAALASVLDAEHVEAVIDHRKAKRSPLTVKAAELLARDLSDGDPNDNADEMIRRGWTGFKVGWRRESATGPPASRSTNGMAAVLLNLQRDQHEQRGETEPDAFDAPPDGPRHAAASGRDVERGVAERRGSGIASGQGTGRFRAAGDAGPIIDLEAEPRPPRQGLG